MVRKMHFRSRMHLQIKVCKVSRGSKIGITPHHYTYMKFGGAR